MTSRLEDLVRGFAEHTRGGHREITFYRGLPTLTEAVRCAALCQTPQGGRHSHQWRLKQATLEAAERALQAVLGEIEKATDFDDLYSRVEFGIRAALGDGKIGLGKLYFYDVSLRIGAFLSFLPQRVYVHNGALVGLEKLLGRRHHGRTIEVSDLPEPIRALRPEQIEDFLCIFKAHLGPDGDAGDPLKHSCGPGRGEPTRFSCGPSSREEPRVASRCL